MFTLSPEHSSPTLHHGGDFLSVAPFRTCVGNTAPSRFRATRAVLTPPPHALLFPAGRVRGSAEAQHRVLELTLQRRLAAFARLAEVGGCAVVGGKQPDDWAPPSQFTEESVRFFSSGRSLPLQHEKYELHSWLPARHEHSRLYSTNHLGNQNSLIFGSLS